MLLTRRLATVATVSAALAVGVPAASAAAAATPVKNSVGSPHCPIGYSGPTNAATGCPYSQMVP